MAAAIIAAAILIPGHSTLQVADVSGY